MTKQYKPIGYKVVWQPIEYKPEFLEAQAKRMTDIYKRINKLDDSLEASRSRSIIFVPLALIGAIVGAVCGWFITGLLIH